MPIDALFSALWKSYVAVAPEVESIRKLFAPQNTNIVNDHIALRTLQHPLLGIEQLAAPFVALGYKIEGHYSFKKKKLRAVHLAHSNLDAKPKIFISELELKRCSKSLQALIDKKLLGLLSEDLKDIEILSASGAHWGMPSYDVYKSLAEESEYAAWFYIFGFIPNHFTVKVNDLMGFDTIESVNDFLEQNGCLLNSVGGGVKGKPSDLLQQSSTMASSVNVQFQEGNYAVPSCFYEFALRYNSKNGEQFSGFLEGNADKIFESTNRLN
jgi:hypothetical protein